LFLFKRLDKIIVKRFFGEPFLTEIVIMSSESCSFDCIEQGGRAAGRPENQEFLDLFAVNVVMS
jgi:hypothetical protein